jgi:hypothetical protein
MADQSASVNINSAAAQIAVGAPVSAQSNIGSSVIQNGLVSQNVTFNFKPNILDSNANYTYHIRWSMTSDNDATAITKSGVSSASSTFRNGVGKIIIAESGVTSQYNIIDLEITTLLPGYEKTPQTNEITADMTVVEPYGITLMDNLYNAARNIGISNYLQCHSYFLEIWFNGYDENGVTNSNLNNIYKVWQVDIKDIESTTTESGTTYKIKFLVHNMYTTADHVAVLNKAVNIGPVSTIGQFFDQLAVEMTNQNANLYEGKKPKITYKFNTSFAKNWKFDTAPVNSQRQFSTNGNVNNPTIQLGQGMDVNNIVNFVTSMTQDGQNWSSGSGNANNSAGTIGAASLKANGMANLIVIYGWSEINGPFDTQLNDYPRTVTYTFVQYPTSVAIIDLQNAANTRQPTVQQARQLSLAQSNNFIKHYFWTYTGQNLDINKFELKLSIKDQLAIVQQLGKNTYSNFTVGPQLNNAGVAIQSETQTNIQKQATVPAQSNNSGTNLLGLINSSTSALTSAAAIAGSAAQSQTNQILGPNNSVSQLFSSSQQASVTPVNQSPGQTAATAAAGQIPSYPNTAITYVKGAFVSGVNKLENSLGLGNNSGNLPIPVTLARKASYLEDVGTPLFAPNPFPISGRGSGEPLNQQTIQGGDGKQQTATSGETVDNTPPTRSIMASILNEAKSQSLARMELEIRGDPYWLGFSNIDELNYINSGNSPPAAARLSSAWFYSGDVGYVFTLRTGTSYAESTGLMNFNDKTVMWNGFWKVIKVKSIFKNGTFIQKLDSKRDLLSNPPTNPPTTASTAISAAASAVSANFSKIVTPTADGVTGAGIITGL